MKLFSFLVLIFSQMAFADLQRLPDWITDDKVKVWVVRSLLVNAADEFYNIRFLKAERGTQSNGQGEEAESLAVTLSFSTPKCEQNEIKQVVLAPWCKPGGCFVSEFYSHCGSAPDMSTTFRQAP
jgi:hypothetical protein